jgi:cell division septation protein DedD
VVWLGLALGAIVGAYFVGFFSGRYVGFESARESSAGEVAKLPVPEIFQGSAGQNPGGVYDKLKAPALLRDAEPDVRAAKVRPSAETVAADARLEEIKKEVEAANRNESLQPGDAEDEPSVLSGEEGASEQDIENMISEPRRGPEVIIGADEGINPAKVPDSVRLLGTGKTESKEAQAKAVAPGKSEKSATTLLDERIANARSDAAKGGQGGETAGKVAARDSGPLVRKVIPSGYFAQVAAPKKLAEAESIAGKLKRSGFPVVVESASVAGQGFYRVLVGPEQNKLQADRLVSQLKSEKYIAGNPFIRRVK